MKQFVVILLLCFLPIKVFSTEQVTDYLIFGKDTLRIYKLQGYFNSPFEKIDIDSITYNIRKHKSVAATYCWRGFYAEWKIIDNKLYLSKVFDCQTHEAINKIVEEVLGREFVNGLMNADWVNGSFSCGKGYMHYNYYRYNLILVFEKGEIIRKDEFQIEKPSL